MHSLAGQHVRSTIPAAARCTLNLQGVTTGIPADISPDGLTRATVYRWAAGGTASGLLTATACSAGQGETELYLASAYSDGTTADVVL